MSDLTFWLGILGLTLFYASAMVLTVVVLLRLWK